MILNTNFYLLFLNKKCDFVDARIFLALLWNVEGQYAGST